MLLPGTFDEQEQKNGSKDQRRSLHVHESQAGPEPPTNTEKQPDEWVSGDDSMTGAQASYLKILSEEAGDPDAYDENLTKAEASKRIDALKQELGLE